MKLENTPPEVLIAKFGGLISLEYYNSVLEKYPEYFKEEIARKEAWESIPEKVHEDYCKAYFEMREEVIDQTIPENIFKPKENHGLMWQIENAEKLKEYHKHLNIAEKKIGLKDKMLREKFYEKYKLD